MSLGRSLGASLGGSLAGSLSGAGAVAPVSPYVPPIGVTPLVLWDARGGVAQSGGMVDSWTDQIRGLVLSGTGTARPAFSVDGTNFLGRSVVQFDGVDDTLQNVNFAPPIFGAGTSPHWFYVFRRRALSAGATQTYFTVLDNPPTTLGPASLVADTDEFLRHYYYPKPIELNNTLALNLAPHLQESWISASGTFSSRDGGPASSTADGNPVAQPMKSVYLANDRGSNFAPLTLAAIGCYGAPLTTTQRADLLTYYTSAWGVPSPLPPVPVPASAVEWWHAERECTPLAWKGQLGGRVLPADGTPQVGTDPGYFAGKQVAKTFSQADGAGAYIGTGLAALAAVGTTSYIASIFRVRDPVVADGIYYVLGIGAGTSPNLRIYRSVNAGSGVNRLHGVWYGGNANGPSPIDTGTHFAEAWANGTNAILAIDGIEYAVPSTQVSVASFDNASIGGAPNNPTFHQSANHAFHLFCSAVPTPAERAALRDWAKTYWGVVSQRPPLPASAVEYWHSELECLPASWRGQILGSMLVSQGATPPLVEPDPGCFNGRVVGKSAAANQSRWRNATAFSPALIPVGSRPYIFAVARAHDNTALQSIFCFTQGFASGATGYLGVNAGRATARYENRVAVLGQTQASNVAHFAEYWVDGTNQNLQGEQNTLFQAADGGVSTTTINAITIGASPSGSATYNASHAFYLFCSDIPTVAERDALKAWARAYWGIA